VDRRRRLLLTVLGGGAPVETVTKLFYDTFTTDASPAGTNAAEPGPGTGTSVDPSSRYTKSGGELVGVPGGAGTFTSYRRDGTPHALGTKAQAVVERITAVTVRKDIVAGSGTTSNQTPRIEAGSPINMRAINTGSVNTPSTFSLPQMGAILRDASGRVAMFWDNKLYWVDEATDTSSWYGFDSIPTTAAGGNASDIQMIEMTSFWNDLYTVASVNVASPVAATNYTATANQVVRLTVTAPGVLANRAGVIFRGDATNGWIAYCDSAGAFKVDSVAAGVPTNRINVAGVIAGGATATISLVMDGNLINAHTIASGAPTNRGTQINNSHQASSANLMVEVGVGWAVSNLRSWQVDMARYATDFAF
jgi:hypothetical protein